MMLLASSPSTGNHPERPLAGTPVVAFTLLAMLLLGACGESAPPAEVTEPRAEEVGPADKDAADGPSDPPPPAPAPTVEAEQGPPTSVELRGELHDLHHPTGALKKATFSHPQEVLEILEEAGYDATRDGIRDFRFAGQLRTFFFPWDRVAATLPRSSHRWSLPSPVHMLSIGPRGGIRYSTERSMARPVYPADQERYATELIATAEDSGRPLRRPTEVGIDLGNLDDVLILDGEGAFHLNGRRFEGRLLPEKLHADPPQDGALLILPSPSTTIASLTLALDGLYIARERGVPMRTAVASLEKGHYLSLLAPDFRPLDEPVMVIKTDAGVTWNTVQPLLQRLAAHLPRVILLTDLDIDAPGILDEAPFPGGLPGGLPLEFVGSSFGSH